MKMFSYKKNDKWGRCFYFFGLFNGIFFCIYGVRRCLDDDDDGSFWSTWFEKSIDSTVVNVNSKHPNTERGTHDRIMRKRVYFCLCVERDDKNDEKGIRKKTIIIRFTNGNEKLMYKLLNYRIYSVDLILAQLFHRIIQLFFSLKCALIIKLWFFFSLEFVVVIWLLTAITRKISLSL